MVTPSAANEVSERGLQQIANAVLSMRAQANDLMSSLDRDLPYPYASIVGALTNFVIFLQSSKLGLDARIRYMEDIPEEEGHRRFVPNSAIWCERSSRRAASAPARARDGRRPESAKERHERAVRRNTCHCRPPTSYLHVLLVLHTCFLKCVAGRVLELFVLFTFNIALQGLYNIHRVLHNPFGPRHIDVAHEFIAGGIRRLAESLAEADERLPPSMLPEHLRPPKSSPGAAATYGYAADVSLSTPPAPPLPPGGPPPPLGPGMPLAPVGMPPPGNGHAGNGYGHPPPPPPRGPGGPAYNYQYDAGRNTY